MSKMLQGAAVDGTGQFCMTAGTHRNAGGSTGQFCLAATIRRNASVRQQAAAVADLAGQQQGVHGQEVGQRAHARQRLRLRRLRQASGPKLNSELEQTTA